WESFHLGGVLAGQVDLAGPLARQGSERAARQLVTAVRALETAEEGGRDSVSEGLLFPLAALVESSGACTEYGESFSLDVERGPEAGPIGGDVQEDVLELLAEHVGADAGLSEAETASHLLVQRCRPESQPTFRAMLRSPYGEVRHRGAIALRALGETVGDPPPSRPVSFRVLVDGKPTVDRTV